MQPINFNTSLGNIVIREAQLMDAVQYRELRLNALLDSPTAFSADYQINLNQPMNFWENRVTPDEQGVLFLAEHKSRLIGMTGIRRGDSPKTKHGAGIWGVYVGPEWRGLHIAEALIEACIKWAKTQQIEMVKLGVVTTNTSAVHCYQRCGFTIYGTDPRDIFYEGKFHDLYLMYRDIQ